ncbi:MAG: hypothetical protein FJW85_03635 [Actinobacteria bacterium]|nr:hypothetical protein [Actinomycetota bacterium]
MTTSSALLTLALPAHEGRLLAAHLDRLASWDPTGHVRIVARAGAIGVYAAPPMRVISFVALPLRDPVTEEVDVSARTAQVRQGLEATAGATELCLPEPAVGSPGLAMLPPAEGWQLPIHGVSGDVVPGVDEAIAEFRRRSTSVVDPQALAEQIWGRPSFGGLPLRVLHAARRLGFLTDDASRVTACTMTGWKRLTTVRGQVFVRTSTPTQRPDLSVVR